MINRLYVSGNTAKWAVLQVRSVLACRGMLIRKYRDTKSPARRSPRGSSADEKCPHRPKIPPRVMKGTKSKSRAGVKTLP